MSEGRQPIRKPLLKLLQIPALSSRLIARRFISLMVYFHGLSYFYSLFQYCIFMVCLILRFVFIFIVHFLSIFIISFIFMVYFTVCFGCVHFLYCFISYDFYFRYTDPGLLKRVQYFRSCTCYHQLQAPIVLKNHVLHHFSFPGQQHHPNSSSNSLYFTSSPFSLASFANKIVMNALLLFPLSLTLSPVTHVKYLKGFSLLQQLLHSLAPVTRQNYLRTFLFITRALSLRQHTPFL